MASNGKAMTPEALVNRCLDQMGPLEVSEATRKELISQAESEGSVSWATEEEYAGLSRRVGEMLGLIAATRRVPVRLGRPRDFRASAVNISFAGVLSC